MTSTHSTRTASFFDQLAAHRETVLVAFDLTQADIEAFDNPIARHLSIAVDTVAHARVDLSNAVQGSIADLQRLHATVDLGRDVNNDIKGVLSRQSDLAKAHLAVEVAQSRLAALIQIARG